MMFIKLVCGHVCEVIFLINDWHGRVQPTVGSTTPEQTMVGYIGQQREQVMESE